jgi:RNA polymerase sigma factor (sigma-70 family)
VHSTQLNLRKYGLRLLKDNYIIENIVQDAFLKLWEFRDTITSLEHAERFLKQAVKWGCHAYFRNASSRFHRRMVQLDAFDNNDSILATCGGDPIFNESEDSVFDQRLQEAWLAIANLFYGREKEVLELFYIKGFTHTQIADRYGISIRTITLILDKGKLRLKTMLVTAPKRIKSRSIQKQHFSDLLTKSELIEGLNAEQNAIYQLRLIGKYNFDQIAVFLHLTTSYIQLEYIKAWKIVDWQKKKNKANKRLSRWNANPLHSTRLLSA